MSRPGKFILIVFACYAALKAPGVLLGMPIPGSLITMYMIFVVLTVLMVMTSSQGGAEELVAPISGFFANRRSFKVRIVALAVFPALAGYVVLRLTSPDAAVTVRPRVMHPTPPHTITAYNKEFDLAKLENPYRSFETTDRAQYTALVKEGGDIYFRNCVFCHGAKLDGAGQFAAAMDPMPAAFKGSDTIAQLQESYVFWRIVKGGRGLPAQGAQSTSAMPAWEEGLTEDEVWKTILYLYDFTENRPRVWKK